MADNGRHSRSPSPNRGDRRYQPEGPEIQNQSQGSGFRRPPEQDFIYNPPGNQGQRSDQQTRVQQVPEHGRGTHQNGSDSSSDGEFYDAIDDTPESTRQTLASLERRARLLSASGYDIAVPNTGYYQETPQDRQTFEFFREMAPQMLEVRRRMESGESAEQIMHEATENLDRSLGELEAGINQLRLDSLSPAEREAERLNQRYRERMERVAEEERMPVPDFNGSDWQNFRSTQTQPIIREQAFNDSEQDMFRDVLRGNRGSVINETGRDSSRYREIIKIAFTEYKWYQSGLNPEQRERLNQQYRQRMERVAQEEGMSVPDFNGREWSRFRSSPRCRAIMGNRGRTPMTQGMILDILQGNPDPRLDEDLRENPHYIGSMRVLFRAYRAPQWWLSIND